MCNFQICCLCPNEFRLGDCLHINLFHSFFHQCLPWILGLIYKDIITNRPLHYVIHHIKSSLPYEFTNCILIMHKIYLKTFFFFWNQAKLGFIIFFSDRSFISFSILDSKDMSDFCSNFFNTAINKSCVKK